MKPFKPMLADTFDGVLRYEDYVISPKLDGIRCIIRDGQPVSRSLKVIPNRYVQEVLSQPELANFDGELIVGAPNDPDVYRNTNSGVMRQSEEPDFLFHVFDVVPENTEEPFRLRLGELLERHLSLPSYLSEFIRIVPQTPVSTMEQLEVEERRIVNEGFEGAMLRRQSSVYKFGRATLKRGELLKVKRFENSEAQVVGFEPLMKNENEATTNALGHTERSSHQAGKVAQELLGNLLVLDIQTGERFSIGSGFTMKEREELWAERDTLTDRIVTYQHFPIGRKDAPRFPTFKGFRSLEDMAA